MTASRRTPINWSAVLINYILIAIGTAITAVAVIVFQLPSNIAPGGVTGVAIILNFLFDTPIGLMTLLLNIPIMIIGYRMLGWQSLAGTIFCVVLFATYVEVFMPLFPPGGIAQDNLLNALYAGIIGGIGGGLVLRAGATLGGTSTLIRILNERFGLPISSGTLYLDTGVIVAAGLVFGWEPALYAMITLFIGGVASDYILEGPSVIRTAVIITDRPREVADIILNSLRRGVTGWEGKGMFTEQSHTILYVTVARSQVTRLRNLVLEADPNAFIVIGQGHTAYGRGFRVTKPKNRATEQPVAQ